MSQPEGAAAPPLRVALAGFGSVGQGIAQALAERPVLQARVRIVAVADRGGVAYDPGGLDPARLLRAKQEASTVEGCGPYRFDSVMALLASGAPVDALAELTPTDLRDASLALEHVEAAFDAGTHVVLANKGPLALHWARVHRAAAQAGSALRFSATVCGGVPVLEVGLGTAAVRADRLLRLEGVLNGSTNFVLAALEEGAALEDALREARKRGILEADPSLDLLGIDARAKACILANALFPRGATQGGRPLRLDDVAGEGILGITTGEAVAARRRGSALRLVARVDAQGAGVRVVELPRDHPLRVEGTENAVRLTFDLAGPLVLRGAGAGPRETASAVLSDLVGLPAGRVPSRRGAGSSPRRLSPRAAAPPPG